MTPEGKVKLDIKRWLKAHGYWWFTPVSNGMGKHGIPDFVGCKPVVVTPQMVGKTIGVFYGIEAKAPGGRVSVHQVDRITEINATGGIAFVAYGTNQLPVLEIFDGYETEELRERDEVRRVATADQEPRGSESSTVPGREGGGRAQGRRQGRGPQEAADRRREHVES
jgi:hypothetical protein